MAEIIRKLNLFPAKYGEAQAIQAGVTFLACEGQVEITGRDVDGQGFRLVLYPYEALCLRDYLTTALQGG